MLMLPAGERDVTQLSSRTRKGPAIHLHPGLQKSIVVVSVNLYNLETHRADHFQIMLEHTGWHGLVVQADEVPLRKA